MMTSSLPDARTFLARYWQKKPLFARGALPRFTNVLGRAEIFELACRNDVDSRLVTGARKSTLCARTTAGFRFHPVRAA